MYGLAIAAVIAVLMTMIASLTLLPAMLSRFGDRMVRPHAAGSAVRLGEPPQRLAAEARTRCRGGRPRRASGATGARSVQRRTVAAGDRLAG